MNDASHLPPPSWQTVSKISSPFGQVRSSSGEMQSLNCGHLVNAAGPWASDIATMAGIGDPHHPNPVMRTGLPVRPRKRCVFVFKCPGGPVTDCPLVVTPGGAYFRRENNSGTFICGVSPAQVSGLGGGGGLLFCKMNIDATTHPTPHRGLASPLGLIWYSSSSSPCTHFPYPSLSASTHQRGNPECPTP